MVNVKITILELMARYGIETYKELAEIGGFHEETIKGWMSKRTPSLKSLIRLRESVIENYKKEVVHTTTSFSSSPIKTANNKL